MGRPTTTHDDQADRLREFITANTILDHVEISHALVGFDPTADAWPEEVTLLWLALGMIGDDLYMHASGDSSLDALAQLAIKLTRGTTCPNCRKTVVLYDGQSERWTYAVGLIEPWGDEHVCPLWFDGADWRRACMKEPPDG